MTPWEFGIIVGWDLKTVSYSHWCFVVEDACIETFSPVSAENINTDAKKPSPVWDAQHEGLLEFFMIGKHF